MAGLLATVVVPTMLPVKREPMIDSGHRVADPHGNASVQPGSSRKVDDAFAVNHS